MNNIKNFTDFINESKEMNEASAKPAAYQKAGKLGYNDQFLGRNSLSWTLSVDLGMNPKHEFSGGDWLGFDHVSMYVGGGKKEGTILDDALTGKYTYDELKSAAADFLGIRESVEINESTRSQFGKIDKRGNITSVYMHYDGYPENILPILRKGYKGGKNVDYVISQGAGSGLEANPKNINFYNDNSGALTGNVTRVANYLSDAEDDAGAEYVYLWDERSKQWMMASYGERDLRVAEV